jgi:monovalent cation/proton antiporter MnhG/PhaG subunit
MDMTGFLIILGLLILMAIACWIGCLGILVMHGAYDKLHYLAPAAIFGMLLLTMALFISDGFSQGTIKSLIILGIVWISNPILVQATARAVKTRQSSQTNKEPEQEE